MQITSITFAFPVERIRGGNIAVAINVTFEDGTTFAGGSFIENEANLPDGIQKAIDQAKALKEQVGQPSKAVTALVEALRQNAVAVKTPVWNKMKAEGKLTEDQYSKLAEPTDDIKRNELNNLCDTLGMTRIDTTTWPMLDTIAVIQALAKFAKKLEAK